MSAYVILEAEVTDPARYEEYKKVAGPLVLSHGGRFLVRGGKIETLDGEPKTGRVVVLEFPSAEAAKAWYDSDAYREARGIRLQTSRGRLFLVEGA